jgi:hypothetical protein
MQKSLYFCGVKTQVRYIAAAVSSVFCACHVLLINTAVEEWGNSNVPNVSALEYVTAPTAAFLFNVKIQVL